MISLEINVPVLLRIKVLLRTLLIVAFNATNL